MNTNPISFKDFSATFARLRCTGNRSISAFTRTVFSCTVRSFSRINGFAAMLAFCCAALVARLGGPRPWSKLQTTFRTWTRRCTIWKLSFGNRFRVCVPVLHFRATVARWAKCYQVNQCVRFLIIDKQVEWLLVVNRQSRFRHSTYLTCFVVTEPSGSGLHHPIRTTCFNMASTPRRVIFSAPMFRCPPFPKALPSAEINRANSGGLFTDHDSASSTWNVYALFANAYVVDRLPFSVATHPTKMTLRDIRHVGFGLIRSVALFTN